MKEILKSMKETLTHAVQAQITNLECVDYKELGEAIDMIKDLEETLYYCAIVEAMEEKNDKEPEVRNNTYYYTESKYMPMKDWDYYRDIDRPYGMMYYGGNTSSSGSMSQGGRMSSSSSYGNEGSDGRMNYSEPFNVRDAREGRSPMSRRQYMESKELHMDKTKQLKDLEKYMSELTQDIAELIDDATPEEKQLMQKKISTLATKIEQMK